MAGLKKGQTNNPDGRPKGSPNKVTKKLRERISDFLEENWEKIEKDFDQLEPKERVSLFEKLLQYTVPKLQSTELKTPDQEPDTELKRRAWQRAMEIADLGRDEL